MMMEKQGNQSHKTTGCYADFSKSDFFCKKIVNEDITMARNRTRINYLEDSDADHITTNAFLNISYFQKNSNLWVGGSELIHRHVLEEGRGHSGREGRDGLVQRGPEVQRG